jgi:hypothetical protein
MLGLGKYKGGYTYSIEPYDEKWFNMIVERFFTEKKKWVAPVLPPPKPDPFADFLDNLIKYE